jgi:diguanylate cyclase (GGDEF)-like protein
MDIIQGKFMPSLWPPVEEDPSTGFPNLFALLSDLRGAELTLKGTCVGLRLRRMGDINAAYGAEAGDEDVIRLSKSILKAASEPVWSQVRYYRLAGDEFCLFFPNGTPEDARSFIALLESDESCPAVTHAIAPQLEEPGEPPDVFLSIWALLQPRSSQDPTGKDKSATIVKRLVAAIGESVDLLRDARRLAYTDDTSGLPNHRAALYRIKALLSSPDPEGRQFSLLFVDGDNLRQYNEEMGYEAGNEMIKRLGEAISGATRPGETIARWLSGDEFMVILPGVDKTGAIERAKRICASVQKEAVLWPLPVTVSIGVVTCPDDGVEIDRLLAKAEKANSNAKKLGKNRVCAAGIA